MTDDTTGTDTTGSARPAARRFTRRRFVAVAVLGAAAATGIAAWADGARTRARAQRAVRLAQRARAKAGAYAESRFTPAERIVRHFDYLQHDAAGVERYVRDFEAKFGRVNARSVESNELLYTKYLLSTNFFVNGADESKPVRYMALYHPHVTPCWNPIPPAQA